MQNFLSGSVHSNLSKSQQSKRLEDASPYEPTLFVFYDMCRQNWMKKKCQFHVANKFPYYKYMWLKTEQNYVHYGTNNGMYSIVEIHSSDVMPEIPERVPSRLHFNFQFFVIDFPSGFQHHARYEWQDRVDPHKEGVW